MIQHKFLSSTNGATISFQIDHMMFITKKILPSSHMIGGIIGAQMVCSMVPMPRDNGEWMIPSKESWAMYGIYYVKHEC